MKLLFKDIKKGEIRVKVENQEDLWYLSNIIDESDLIKGKTLRKIKLGEKEQRSQKIIKKVQKKAKNFQNHTDSKDSLLNAS